jgi:hypothetical protein
VRERLADRVEVGLACDHERRVGGEFEAAGEGEFGNFENLGAGSSRYDFGRARGVHADVDVVAVGRAVCEVGEEALARRREGVGVAEIAVEVREAREGCDGQRDGLDAVGRRVAAENLEATGEVCGKGLQRLKLEGVGKILGALLRVFGNAVVVEPENGCPVRKVFEQGRGVRHGGRFDGRDVFLRDFFHGHLRGGVEAAEGVHGVAEKFRAHGHCACHGPDVHHAAMHGKLAFLRGLVAARVTALHKFFEQRVEVAHVADHKAAHIFFKRLRVGCFLLKRGNRSQNQGLKADG